MLDVGGIAARFVLFASALVLFGAPLFSLYGFVPGERASLSRQRPWMFVILGVAVIGAALGAISGIIVLTMQIFPDAPPFDREALETLLTGTGFGRIVLVRLGLIGLVATSLALTPRGKIFWIVQTALGAAIVLSFAWSGHAVRDDGAPGLLHQTADALHLLSAGVWIGALVSLSAWIATSLRRPNQDDSHALYIALERFSVLGLTAVALIVATGAINSWFLVGIEHSFALFTTGYGRVLLAKVSMFAVMLPMAALNRYRLMPRLALAGAIPAHAFDAAATQQVLKTLRVSVFAETILGCCVLAAVALLGTMEPSMSATSGGG